MVYAGSPAVLMLEKFGFLEKLDHIIMSGGATASLFWPQVIADICGKTIKAIDFSEFTAYGAALHAKSAFRGKSSNLGVFDMTESRNYESTCNNPFRYWSEQY